MHQKIHISGNEIRGDWLHKSLNKVYSPFMEMRHTETGWYYVLIFEILSKLQFYFFFNIYYKLIDNSKYII